MYICTSLIIRLQASLDACFGFSEVVDAFIKYQSKFKFKFFLFRLERTTVYVGLILCDGVCPPFVMARRKDYHNKWRWSDQIHQPHHHHTMMTQTKINMTKKNHKIHTLLHYIRVLRRELEANNLRYRDLPHLGRIAPHEHHRQHGSDAAP